MAGKYHFTSKDFLNEGADALPEIGTPVIKVWFTPRPRNDYPFNSTWSTPASLVDLARSPYFRALFAKGFTTSNLETFDPGRPVSGDCRGFWLVRPDGSRAPVGDYFRGLMPGPSPARKP